MATIKKNYLLLVLLMLTARSFSQVTVAVTNPTNTTPNLASGYVSLAAAVTAVNGITSMSGPVTLTCASGSETAPAGGYSIISPGGTSATNTITFTTSGTVTITASPSLAAGSLTDAIFKLVGADYITINGFVLKENPANTNAISATNNMTEWGIALLYASTTNGSQNNTIQNNSITLDRNYLNSFGIYSNTRHSATNVSGDISNNTTGPNSYNKFYNNLITNVNYGIALIGSGISANQDQGNDIGGNSAATGNTITNWGKDTTSNVYNGGPYLGLSAIFANNQSNENVSYNTLVSATLNYATATYVSAIDKEYFSSQPVGTVTSNITHNTITITDSSVAGGFFFGNYTGAIVSGGITGLSTATININYNLITNCAEVRAASSRALIGVYNYSAVGVLNINNNVIRAASFLAPASSFVGLENNGAVINTININNNQLGVAGSGLVNFSDVNDHVNCIFNGNAGTNCTVNINANSFDGISARTGNIAGISLTAGGFFSTPAPDFININNNQFGSVTGNFASLSDAPTSPGDGVTAISNNIGDSTTVAHIDNNDFRGINYALTGTYGSVSFIAQNSSIFGGSVAGSLGISNNTFTNLSLNVNGAVTFISNDNPMVSGNSFNCTNNHIVGTFNKTGTGSNSVMCINTSGSALNGSAITLNNNNFSNITLSGTGNFYGVFDQSGTTSNGPAKLISNNTFSNVNYGSSTAYGISLYSGGGTICSSNSISGFSGSGIFTGVSIANSVGGNLNIDSNTISNITATSLCYGITGGSASIPVLNINGNTINSITCPNNNPLYISLGATVNIFDNSISGVTSSSAAATFKGINTQTCTAVNVYRNKLNSFSATAASGSGTAIITGLFFNGTNTTVNVYNNFIADLSAPGFSGTEVIRGMAFFGGTNSAFNVYYNSVYLNSTTTASDFGTTCIYHLVNSTASSNNLKLIDNILVNQSTSAGSGKAVAFYNSSYTTLANYDLSSDYNLLYAGSPSASRLIYYDGLNADQSLPAFKARVTPREANDISLMPNFTSATDLHLTPANCLIDGMGIPIAGFTTDIDNATRNISAPDMGADEFTSAAGTTAASSTSCENKTVAGGGTTYINSSCELIANVMPSGANPVGGMINTCVTLDAVQKYFNAEPYVQRHFDIEPATSNTTTTSATVTLYFTNAEFVLFNTNNPAWPKLPTVAGGGNADPNRANLKVTQYHGTANVSPSVPGNYSGGGAGVLINPLDANIVWNGSFWAVTFDVTGFSGFYVHSNPLAPLSVVPDYIANVIRNRTNGVALLNIAPNPVSGNTLKLRSNAATVARMNVTITDAQGRLMKESMIRLTSGTNISDIDVTNLAPGTYQLYGKIAGERTGILRFVKQ